MTDGRAYRWTDGGIHNISLLKHGDKNMPQFVGLNLHV